MLFVYLTKHISKLYNQMQMNHHLSRHVGDVLFPLSPSSYAGFLPPSGGTAIVNGYNIRRDIDSVRSSLGLCPQHNVLFDTMTVEEHLIFFALVSPEF